MLGKLYLIPTTLGGENINDVIPANVIDKTREIDHFIVEDIRSARRYLSKLKPIVPINEIQFFELNEHTTQIEAENLTAPLLQGKLVGLLSEAGVPAVADPGSNIVALAHRMGIEVIPLTGPSSILMAVMASGLSGQNFAFVGYLPVQQHEREKRIRQLELRSLEEQQAQFFIETPYRNNQMLQSLADVLAPHTLVTVACDLTRPSQFISTRKAADWKKEMPDLHKRPSIFGIMQ